MALGYSLVYTLDTEWSVVAKKYVQIYEQLQNQS